MSQEHYGKSSLRESGSPASAPQRLDTDEAKTQPPQQPATLQGLDEPSIPLGATRAWLQVLGGFLAFLNIWGFPISFGVFQTFYAFDYLQDYSASSISWIGTVQNFLVSMVSVLSGPIYDLGYYRTLVYLGSFLSVFGIMMLSLSTQYYQLFLSHTCNGVGSGLLYVPTLALVAQGHGKTRSLAMGIVASGIALGGVTYTIIFLRLQPTVGFPWTVRTIGFIAFLCYAVAIPCLIGGPQTLKPRGKARALLDLSAFKNPAWFAYSIAQFMSFWGYLVPMFYVPTYARVVLRSSQSTGEWLLVAIQGASLLGRLGAALAAHYTGVMLPLTTCIGISGLLSLAWLGTHNVGGFAVYCVLYGVFSGALIALPPSIFPAVCPKVSVQGTWMGMAWAITSIASLTGAPIAGSFVNLQTGDFIGVQIWSGVILLAASGLFGVLWFVLARRQHKVLI